MEEELNTREVAKRLGVSPATVVRWLAQGHFPNARRRGPARNSPWRIPIQDAEELERRLRQPRS